MEKKLRRVLLLILAGLVLLCTLTACRKSRDADEVALYLLNGFPALPPCSQYVKQAEPYAKGYISKEDFACLYKGEKTVGEEWELCQSFRLILSDTTCFFEIHVLESVSAEGAATLEKMLNRRKQMLNAHILAETDYPTEKAVVFRRGRYAVLLATPDNAGALRTLKKILPL